MTAPRLAHALRHASVLGLAAGAAVAAQADPVALPNELRLGMYVVHYATTAHDVTGPFTPAGLNLRVGNGSAPCLTLVRRLDAHWDVEVAAGVPPTARTYGQGPAKVGAIPFDGQELATARGFAPTLLLDYRLRDEAAALRPYVGVGVNYTRFYRIESTPAGDAANGGPTRIRLSRSIGPAATLGLVYRLAPRVSLVASYSLARVDSHYRSDTSGVIRQTTIHFNPRVAVAEVGYAF